MTRRPGSVIAATGAVVVSVAIAQVLGMGAAIVGLDACLLLAWAVWACRPPISAEMRGGVARLFAAAIAVQIVHFTEELSTGFAQQFPAMFGYTWSNQRFAIFNLLWLAVFAAAALGVRRGRDSAAAIAWFFAIGGGLANGVAHLGLTLARAAYFPGAATAPFVLAMGLALTHRLVTATSATHDLPPE